MLVLSLAAVSSTVKSIQEALMRRRRTIGCLEIAGLGSNVATLIQ